MLECLAKLKNQENLTANEIETIASRAISLLILEPNIKSLESPVTVVGDIHGQFSDLLNIFELFKTPLEVKFIFLGDYVDRGKNSTSTYLILLIYKILYPENIFLVRGNHEVLNRQSSFQTEVVKKYNEEVYEIICSTFPYLLVGCIVDGRHLLVHGGISPTTPSISQIQRIDRFSSIVDTSFNDIMWSDPGTLPGFTTSTRGAGYNYGEDVVKNFLSVNQLNYIIRAHQLIYSGFAFHFKDKCVITVWSAPNYMYRFGNKASVLTIKSGQVINDSNFSVFTEVHRNNNEP